MNPTTFKSLLLIALVYSMAACSTQPLNKAVIDIATISEAIKQEREINARSDLGAPDAQSWFVTLEGARPVIITAPHATRPFREGSYRFTDGAGTAALAIALHKITGASVIYTNYQSPSDPNFYDENEFKQKLAELIIRKKPKLIIDVHGSHPYRPYDVDLGTLNGHSLLGNHKIAVNLIKALQNEGILNISHNYFAAEKNQTITKFSAAHGVPAVQMEINATWLMPGQSDLAAHRFAQLLQGLVRYVGEIK